MIYNPEGLTFEDARKEADRLQAEARILRDVGLVTAAEQFEYEAETYRGFAMILAGEDPLEGDEA